MRLTPKEFELLLFLAQHPGRVLTHRDHPEGHLGPNAVDQPEHCACSSTRCAASSNAIPAKPRYITTEPWVGYRFAEE